MVILGKSGCGKTTTLRIIGGFLPADSGLVLLDGKPVEGPSRQMIMVFQSFDQLFPWFTLEGNLIYALKKAKKLKDPQVLQSTACHYLEITGLLEADEDRLRASLSRKKAELEAQILELQQISAEMGKCLKKEMGRNEMSEEIRIVETTEMPVFALRQHMAVKDFGTAFGKLFEKVTKDHLQPAGPTGARYYDEEFDRDDSDVEVFIPLATKKGANASVGGMTCAKLTHKGGYSTLDESYAMLVKWIEENGYRTTGAPYELYVKTGYENPNPEPWETDIYFPVTKQQGCGQSSIEKKCHS